MKKLVTSEHGTAPPLYPELFIGLVAAVGTDHDYLCSTLEEGLRSFGYKVMNVRLSSLLRAIPAFQYLKTEPFDQYISTHQRAGDEFRAAIENKNALAALGVGEIRELRKQQSGDKDRIIGQTAYIVRSLKTPQEVQLLREIYGNAFVLIASSAPYNTRRRYLAAKIAESHHEFHHEVFFETAEHLIQIDQQEPDKEYGQNLRQSFHRADIFLDASESKSVRESLDRALELVFGNTFHTPSRDEYGMFHAMGAALRSSEPGRQVGAAIATPDGDIITVGTNEVPRAGGGLYWEGDNPDYREFVRGEDSNDAHKRSLIEDLLKRLKEDGWLTSEKSKIEISKLADMAGNPKLAPRVSGAHVTHLIEFGRAVHAEMAALAESSRRGVAVSGATMYVTSFPCHLCARLIVCAGIRRVVYIEPYSKSLAFQLYPDSITADYGEKVSNQVPFEPFVGIAPRKYIEMFTMGNRKASTGKIIRFERTNAIPRLVGSPRAYLSAEKISFGELEKMIERKQLMYEQPELPHV